MRNPDDYRGVPGCRLRAGPGFWVTTRPVGRVICGVAGKLTRRFLLSISLVIFTACGVFGQDQVPSPTSASTQPSPITTDRPAFTDSSIVVPIGTLQFENGFLETGTDGQRTFDFPETLLRFGIASKTELRLTTPDYYDNENTGNGFGDLEIGVKQQLSPMHGVDISLVASLSFPTGATSVSSHGYDPSVQVPWSRSLSRSWTAAGMLSVYWPTQGPRRNVTGQVTFELDRQITRRGTPSSNMRATSPNKADPTTSCILGPLIKSRPINNSTSISDSDCPPPRPLTSWESGTRLTFVNVSFNTRWDRSYSVGLRGSLALKFEVSEVVLTKTTPEKTSRVPIQCCVLTCSPRNTLPRKVEKM